MATILRDWSYQYQWLYDGITKLAALSVGGETRFRQLALQRLAIHPDTKVLDLCCGSGQSTRFLVQYSQNVTGLDIAPISLKRAQQNVPSANYVAAFAEKMPFADATFDLVHTSVALHEMESTQLWQILREVYRVLKPGGTFTLMDLHSPTHGIFWPGLAIFCWLFETETAWQLLQTDLLNVLLEIGFKTLSAHPAKILYAGGSIQVIQVQKPDI